MMCIKFSFTSFITCGVSALNYIRYKLRLGSSHRSDLYFSYLYSFCMYSSNTFNVWLLCVFMLPCCKNNFLSWDSKDLSRGYGHLGICRFFFVVYFFLLVSLLSDRNSACCKNCRFESEGEICQEPINGTCKGHSYCTGQITGQRSQVMDLRLLAGLVISL